MIKLKINQKKYYSKKSAFKALYKKLGLSWKEGTDKGDIWGNSDNSIYIRKLPEDGEWKRFYAHNVPLLIEFLKSIGAIEITGEPFEEVVVKAPEPFHNIEYSGHLGFRELLESLPLNFGVVWGDSLYGMSDEFRRKWNELKVKYKDYKVEDFYDDVEAKNEKKGVDKEEVKVEVKKDEIKTEVVGKIFKKRVFVVKKKKVI